MLEAYAYDCRAKAPRASRSSSCGATGGGGGNVSGAALPLLLIPLHCVRVADLCLVRIGACVT